MRIVQGNKLSQINGYCYVKNEEKPFTGIGIRYYDGFLFFNRQVMDKAYFRNGLLHGESIHYFESGKVNYVYNFKDGKKHGECITYYENGSILTKVNYIDGEEQNN